jgi:hypothetical protein
MAVSRSHFAISFLAILARAFNLYHRAYFPEIALHESSRRDECLIRRSMVSRVLRRCRFRKRREVSRTDAKECLGTIVSGESLDDTDWNGGIHGNEIRVDAVPNWAMCPMIRHRLFGKVGADADSQICKPFKTNLSLF